MNHRKKIQSFVRRHALLIMVLIGLSVAHVAWVMIDQSPPLWDIAGHAQRSAEVAQLVQAGDIGAIGTKPTIYPPFAYAVTGVFFLVGGFHADVPQYSLLVWVLLGSIALYSIAWRLFQRRDVAIAAVLLFNLGPLASHFSHIYDLDFPLTAMVLLSIAALLQTERFTRRGWSIGFGLLVGAALLTKWTAVIFLVTPVLFVIIQALRERKQMKRMLMNIGLALAATLVVAGPWYVLHGQLILQSASATRNNVFSVPFEQLISWGNATFYAQWVSRSITWPLALVVVVGMIAAAIRRKQQDWFVLLWIGVPYVVMTFALYSKESRYLLPVFPALALVSAALLLHLRTKLRWVLGGLVSAIALLFWLQTTWHMNIISQRWIAPLGLQTTYGFQVIAPDKPYFGFSYPTNYHTNVPEVIEAIQHDLPEHTSGTVHIAVAPNSIFLTAQQIQFYARLNGLDDPRHSFVVDYSVSSRIRNDGWEEQIVQADYLITKTGDQGPVVWGPGLRDVAKAERHNDPTTFGQFELLQTWPLHGIESQPQEMRLYRKK